MAITITVKTDATGVAQVNLPVGTFSYKMTGAPAGYLIDGTPQQAVITLGQTTAESVNVSPQNPGSVTITKTDPDGHPVTGVPFSISRGGTTFKNDAVTGEDGTIKIDNLAPTYTYSVTEVGSISGYTPVQQTMTALVTANTDSPVNYQNQMTTPGGTLSFSAADTNYSALVIPNATFELTLQA